ncbi:MAG: hypothetical protein ACJAT2_002199 [Bacteriovoracaceae bacterium]
MKKRHRGGHLEGGLTIIGLMKTLLLLLFCLNCSASEISLSFKNLKSKTGLLQIALFDRAEGFPGDHSRATPYTLDLSTDSEFLLKDITPGEYAIAVYHDENSDFELNTGALGIPKEGFGFSNNPRILFGAPKYKKVKFRLKENESKKMEIKLKHF